MSTRDGAPHRLGLLGCGAFGTFLADVIAELPTAELAAVADTQPDLAVRLAAAHPSATIATDLDGLLADRDIDIVVVATPPWTHATLAVRALRANRHVLVEKPLAIDVDGCRHVVAAAAECRPSRHRRSHAALRATRHGAGPTARGRGRRSTRARPDPALRVRERRRRRRPPVRSLVLGSVPLGRHLHRARRPLLRPRRRPHRIRSRMRSKR